MNNLRIILVAVVLGFCGTLSAQQSLELVDKLPPYRLSATLLNNGHFSVATNYTGTLKQLIYREDGTGNRPINYTSHIHIKIDNDVYQLPFEINQATDQPPPPRALTIRRLFPDTVETRPRINAEMLALLGGSDTVVVLFTMEPIKRASGGFIRLSVQVENRSSRPHSVGVLMLIDSKIGDNDRAPIATSFGYSGVESEFRRGVGSGVPQFWLALEGTPLAPGLAARGNLSEEGLIEPDRFIFGNWVDNTQAAIPGLYRVLWDERTPSGLGYTDSALLLLWEQQQLSRGARALRAATEIGIVDSLSVSQGSGGGGGGGGGGGSLATAGAGSCLQTELRTEQPCGVQPYSVYSPDSVQALYLVTNTATATMQDVRLVVPNVPRGLNVVSTSVPVIQPTLAALETGVAFVSFYAVPRLQAQVYSVPVAFVANASDTLLRDTLCVSVPGIQAQIDARAVTSPRICPGTTDTVSIPIELRGPRCRTMSQAQVLRQGVPALVQLLPPLPTLPADAIGALRVIASPLAEGDSIVQIEVVITDEEILGPGDTVRVQIRDTVAVTVQGFLAEMSAVLPQDTLDLGVLCVNEVGTDSVFIQNQGGCSFDITQAQLITNPGNKFSLPGLTLPVSIPRAARGRIPLAVQSATPGTFTAVLEVRSVARPGVVRVPIRVRVDEPDALVAPDTIDIDTVCVNTPTSAVVRFSNPTACDVEIDTIFAVPVAAQLDFSTTSNIGLTPRGNSSLSFTILQSTSGPIAEQVIVRIAGKPDKIVAIRGTAAIREVSPTLPMDAGQIRVGSASTAITQTLTNTGNVPITISSITVQGPHSADFTITAAPQTIPFVLLPGQFTTLSMIATPSDLEFRNAVAVVQTSRPLCNGNVAIPLRVRGIRPVLDVNVRGIVLNAECVGAVMDTSLVFSNIGNASLTITGVTLAGTPTVQPQNIWPVVLDSGASVRLPLTVTASGLGTQLALLSVTHTGEWVDRTDTSVAIESSGLLCGLVYADTVIAAMGSTPQIRLHLQPRGLTAQQAQELLSAQASPVQITVKHNTLLRFTNNVQGALAGATTTITPDAIVMSISADQIAAQSTSLAILEANVLLNSDARTDLLLSVDSLAGGFARIETLPGLLVSEYCAIDKRFVQPKQQPILVWQDILGATNIYSTKTSTVHVMERNLLGQVIATQTLVVPEGTTVVYQPQGARTAWYSVEVNVVE
jgi:hypothetical protein